MPPSQPDHPPAPQRRTLSCHSAPPSQPTRLHDVEQRRQRHGVDATEPARRLVQIGIPAAREPPWHADRRTCARGWWPPGPPAPRTPGTPKNEALHGRAGDHVAQQHPGCFAGLGAGLLDPRDTLLIRRTRTSLPHVSRQQSSSAYTGRDRCLRAAATRRPLGGRKRDSRPAPPVSSATLGAKVWPAFSFVRRDQCGSPA